MNFDDDFSSSTSSSTEISDFEEFEPESLARDTDESEELTSFLRLPPPKNKTRAPAPPAPIEVIPPSIAKSVLNAEKEKDEIIDVDFNKFRAEGEELAKQNALIKDRTQFNGVGYQREKSQLMYLAKLDEETRGAYEQQFRNVTRGQTLSSKMYGW